MTAEEWDACAAPDRMLGALPRQGCDRKLRLWACALAQAEGCAAREVETVREFADGQATIQVMHQVFGPRSVSPLLWLAREQLDVREAAARVAHTLSLVAYRRSRGFAAQRAAQAGARNAQADLLRCVLSNPFRPRLGVDPVWRQWRDGLLVATARRMYDARNFIDMPVLGDMLEDAGCPDAQVLGHCRRPGPHAPGCFVVDALLNL
jgi:hypothetical protein